jgi:hypothetical protein
MDDGARRPSKSSGRRRSTGDSAIASSSRRSRARCSRAA